MARWAEDPPAKITDNAARQLSQLIAEQYRPRRPWRWYRCLPLTTLMYASGVFVVMVIVAWATGLIDDEMIKVMLGR